jgi:DNA repair exonuclease SbcCD ATPase subunit
MRLFHRTKLETLQRQMDSLNQEISELKKELETLKGGNPQGLDPVLHMFLRDRLQFDYEHAKRKWEWAVNETSSLLAQLEKDRQKLEAELREEAFREEFKRRGIKFVGADVEGFDYTLVKFKCSKCGHKFSQDLRNHGSFNNIWLCSTQTALNQIQTMQYNKVWPLQCEKCHAELDVWIWREKL